MGFLFFKDDRVAPSSPFSNFRLQPNHSVQTVALNCYIDTETSTHSFWLICNQYLQNMFTFSFFVLLTAELVDVWLDDTAKKEKYQNN